MSRFRNAVGSWVRGARRCPPDAGPAGVRPGREDRPGGDACRGQVGGPALDDGEHHAAARVHDLRDALCARREGQPPAPDGGHLPDEPGQAHVHVRPPERAQVARRPARPGHRRGGVPQALGREGRRGAEADGQDGLARGHRRQDARAQAEGAVRPGPARPRQGVQLRPVHHPRAAGRAAGGQGVRGRQDRLGALRLLREGVGARAPRPSTSGTRTTCRGRTRPTTTRAPAAPPSTAWSGWSSPTRPRRSPPSRRARSTSSSSRTSTSGRSSARTRTSPSRRSTSSRCRSTRTTWRRPSTT